MKEKTTCGKKSEVDEYGNLGFGLTFLSFRSLPQKFSLVYGHHHDHQDHQDHHRPLACHPHPRHKFSAISQLITIILITRQKQAYGRQGLAVGSLRAYGAQLRSGK